MDFVTALGIKKSSTNRAVSHTATWDTEKGVLKLEINLLALKDAEPNEKGNKVLNVYDKLNGYPIKFSGNVIMATK